jgi:hypothetical protein
MQVAVFLQQLALAKPVAHDESAIEQFFNGLPGRKRFNACARERGRMGVGTL